MLRPNNVVRVWQDQHDLDLMRFAFQHLTLRCQEKHEHSIEAKCYTGEERHLRLAADCLASLKRRDELARR